MVDLRDWGVLISCFFIYFSRFGFSWVLGEGFHGGKVLFRGVRCAEGERFFYRICCCFYNLVFSV